MGPTLSFRGIDNKVFYMLAPRGEYYNFSGCGNTVNCNHPIMRRFIVDCLRFWVEVRGRSCYRDARDASVADSRPAWLVCSELTGCGATQAMPCQALSTLTVLTARRRCTWTVSVSISGPS